MGEGIETAAQLKNAYTLPGLPGKPITLQSCPIPSEEMLKCLSQYACQHAIRLDLRCLLNLNGTPLLGGLLGGTGDLLGGVLGGGGGNGGGNGLLGGVLGGGGGNGGGSGILGGLLGR
ncbi:hypothetical protein DOY81_004278 [Sarcophaga bullata]|nr:hypothetical protein DOY81_004278 [Sarcophaga bullata]